MPTPPTFVVIENTGEVFGRWISNRKSFSTHVLNKKNRFKNFRVISTMQYLEHQGHLYLEIQDKVPVGLASNKPDYPIPFVALYNDWEVLGVCRIEQQ